MALPLSVFNAIVKCHQGNIPLRIRWLLGLVTSFFINWLFSLLVSDRASMPLANIIMPRFEDLVILRRGIDYFYILIHFKEWIRSSASS